MSDTTLPQTFSRHPLLWLAVWFALGIALGHVFGIRSLVSLFIAGLLAIVCIVRLNAAFFLLPVAFVLLGTLSSAIQSGSIPENRIKRIYDEGRIHSGEPVEIEGVLMSFPEPAYGGMFLLLRGEKLTYKNADVEVSGKVRLFFPGDKNVGDGAFDQINLRYGSRLRIYARLEREERFQNPGVGSRIEILDQQGIDGTGTVKSLFLIEKLGEESVFLPLAWIYEQRQRLIYEFRERFSAPTAGVMIASLMGDQHFLDRQTSEAFRDGGTFHVLVISGLHITFIGGLTIWIVSYFVRRRTFQFILAVGFLWAYTFAVGLEAPVVRASIMFTILLFSRVIYREGSQLNALGFCVLLLLAWRPADLFSASFQLTVVSVAAIVGCAFPLIVKLRAIGSWTPTAQRPLPPNVSKYVRAFCDFLYWNDAAWKIENRRQIWSANLYKARSPKWLRSPNVQSVISHIFEGITVSIIVQIWMLPLLVIYFHRVSPISVLLNLWVGLFLAAEGFCAVFTVLIAAFSEWLAAPLSRLTEVMNSLMMWVPSWFSDNRLASFRLPTYTGDVKWIYSLFSAAVVVAAVGIFKWDPFDPAIQAGNTRRRSLTTCLLFTLSLAFIIVFHPYSAPGPDGRLTVDFLDVGQGDSALVTFPNGATMLVDGGGRVDYRADDRDFEPDIRRIGESVVSTFLWAKGYSHIDYIVVTHADADHMQGLNDVARNFDIGLALVGATPVNDPDFSAFMRVLESERIAVTTVHRSDEFSIGGATVQILNPKDDASTTRSANDSSVLMKITFGNRAFLLTGDIERDTENELLADSSCDLRADVIKVPHHGSRTSSTDGFVNRVQAIMAVISVGRRSRFGHPHPEIIARWRESGASVVTTGEKGTVTITTDGNTLQINRFLP
ncbi:MAG: ComEC/Rec2 family competence protein [Acidobacteriota bacterium]